MLVKEQTIREYIEELENRVSEAKKNGNRPEAARCQKAANDLRSFLDEGGNPETDLLPVKLEEYGFGPSPGDEDGFEGPSDIFSEMKALIGKGEYQKCVDLLSNMGKDEPSYDDASVLADNATAIRTLSLAVDLGKGYADEGEWREAVEAIVAGLSSIDEPLSPGPEFEAIRSEAQSLLEEFRISMARADEPKDTDAILADNWGDSPEEDSGLSANGRNGGSTDGADDSVKRTTASEKSDPVPDAKRSEADGNDELLDTNLGSLQSEQAERIHILMKEAQTALDEGKYSLGIEYLNRVLQLDGQHQQATALLFEAEMLKQQQRIDPKKWEHRIESTEDIKELNGILAELETLSTQEPDNEKIRDLFRQVRSKYDQKKKTQGGLTTADAVKNYSVVMQTLEELDLAIQRGEANWYDDRSQKHRPIYEVRDELEKYLPSLAAEVYKRQVARAESFLPHDPHNALKYFKEASHLGSLDEDLKIEVEARCIETEKSVEQWERANVLLKETRSLDDPFERLEQIKAALKEYRHHFQVGEYYKDAVVRVTSILRGSISRTVHDAEAVLLQEQFDGARYLIAEALTQVEVLSEIPETLQDEIDRANSLQKKIAEREERRTHIREQAKSIRKQIDQENFNHAKEIYLALDPDWKQDPEISELRASFQHALDNDDRLKEAQEYFNSSQWQDCINVCQEIGEEGVIGDTVHTWRIQSEINLLKERFRESWAGEFYDEADQNLQTLLSMPELDRERKEGLEDEFSAELATIDRLKKKDPGIAGRLASAEQAVKKKKWLTAFDILTEILKRESTQKGNIRKKLHDVEVKVHDELIEELKDALDNKDYTRSFRKAEALHKRHLFFSEKEGSLRQEAVLEYYRQLTADLEKDNEWEKIEEKWETAAEEFSSDLAIRDELRTAKRKHLIYRCERSLSQLKYEDALDYLVNSNIDFRKIQDLEDLFRTATVLQQADQYVEKQEYVGMATFIRQQMVQFPRPEFEEYLSTRTQKIILGLLKDGDGFIDEGDVARALGKYAVALNLNEDDVAAQSRLQARLPEVRSELRNLLDRANEFTPGSEDVQEKLREGVALNESLKNYRSVLHLIDYESEKFQRAVGGAIDKMDEKIADLQKAVRILERYRPESQSWRAMLRQGIWTQLDEDLRNLATLLSPRHPQYVELSGRKQRMIQLRKELDESLGRMRTSFDSEEFEKAIRFAADAIRVNSQTASSENPDPFGLIEQKARVFHIYSRKDIVGLENIIDLLEVQKSDYDRWKIWYEKTDSRISAMEQAWDEVEKLWARNDHDSFDVSHPTEVGVAAIERCIQLHEEILSLLIEEPETGPESRKGRDMQQKMQGYKVDITKSLDELTTLKQVYEASPYYMDFQECTFQAEELVQQHAFAEALDLINQGLEYDPTNEFLQHLEGICQQNINKKSGFLGGLFQR